MKRSIRRVFIFLIRFRRRLFTRILELAGGMHRAEHILMVLAAICIGTLAAFATIGFRSMIEYSHDLFFPNADMRLSWFEKLPWWQCLLMPALGGLLVGLISRYVAPEVQGSGVPEVMDSVATRGGKIRPRVILAKAAAAAITIGSGGSAGREGPSIHIGSAIGSAFGQFISLSANRLRTFVACGAAAAIAATFNAPIAGALFAVEVIIGDFGVAQFSPVVIASVVATICSRHYLGDYPAFQVPEYELVSSFEFIPFTVLGIAAGLLAVLFIKMLYSTQTMFETVELPHIVKPAIGGFIVGGIAIFFPHVYGFGYESINQALWGQDVQWMLLLIIAAKMVATSFTLGSGGSGGIFAPSLFVGAMLGGIIGQQAHLLQPDLVGPSGAYALVGMGAMVAAMTHAPISAILIIFELTNDYRIIAPLMVSCIVAVLLATWLKRESAYTMKLVLRGRKIFEGRDINILRDIFVHEVLNKDVEKVASNCSFPELIRCMIRSQHQVYFVVDNSGEFAGMISIFDLKQYLKDEDYLSGLVIAADLAHAPPATLYLDDSLDIAMHQFGRYNVDELPVLESDNRKRLAGSVRRREVIERYNQEIFRWDLAGGMRSVVTAVDKDRAVELADGYSLLELEAPNSFIGKTLSQLNVRAQYGIEVILIREAAHRDDPVHAHRASIPTGGQVIQRGDILLVLGEKDNLKRMKS